MQRVNRQSVNLFLPLLLLAGSIPIVLGIRQGLAREMPASDQERNPEALVKANHWKRARAILEPRVKENPDDSRAHYLLARVKMTFNELDSALPLARHAVDLDGRNSSYHFELGKVYGEMAARASFISAGALAVKFRKEVEIAIALDSRNVDALDAMMQFKYQAPSIMGGSRDEADLLADKIAALNACEGYLAHAELAGLKKLPGQMEFLLLRAVQADPGNYDAQTALARFYSEPPHAHYDEAAKHAQAASQLAAGRAEAYSILARIYSAQQRWTDLEQTLVIAEKNVPDDLRPFYEAAAGLLDAGKEFPRAEGYARRYLSQEPEGGEPDAADAHRLLGRILEKEGRTVESRTEFQTVLRLRPDSKAAKDDLRGMDARWKPVL